MKSTSGFTIVEIIMAICIIGIISAISVVSYHKLRENAYDAAAKETLHQVETAFKAYVAGGNKVPMKHYNTYRFYSNPSDGWNEDGVKVYSGGGIGLAMHKANYLPNDLLNPLKNGPKKDPWLKNDIAFSTCGKNKVFFYIEVYSGGIEQRELRNKMDALNCTQKTDNDWLAEHGLVRHAGGWGGGDFRIQPHYLVAEIDFDNEPLDSD